METQKTIEFLKQLTFDLSHGRKSRAQIVHELSNEISPSEMAELPTIGNENEFIQDLYWSLLHSANESGFETSDLEIQYFVECFNGNRVYSKEDFKNYLSKKIKK
jgi:hypothetical protein